MLLKVDDEILGKVIELASKRLISFINILKVDDIHLIEYQEGKINNSEKAMEVYGYLEKFRNNWNTNTLKSFYLYYDIIEDEPIAQFSIITEYANQMELIQLLESSKYFIVDKIKNISIPNGKKTIRLTGEDVINSLIKSLKENLGG